MFRPINDVTVYTQSGMAAKLHENPTLRERWLSRVLQPNDGWNLTKKYASHVYE